MAMVILGLLLPSSARKNGPPFRRTAGYGVRCRPRESSTIEPSATALQTGDL